MGRCLAAALVLLTSLPAIVSAQVARLGVEEPFAPGGLTVSAFAGYRFNFTVEFDRVVDVAGQQILSFAREEVDAAPIIGADLTFPIGGRFAVIGSAAYGVSGSTRTTVAAPDGSAEFVYDGGNFIFAKAGFSYQFLDRAPEYALNRVAAMASVAPAIVRIDPPAAGVSVFSDDAVTQFGIAVAANGIIPLRPWPYIAVDLGVEDFVTFWNTSEVATRLARTEGERLDATVRTEVKADPTHIFMARVGLRIRL